MGNIISTLNSKPVKRLFSFFLLLSTYSAYSSDSLYIKVHFLYGSKPLHKYKNSEQKWFGGLLGGHVGIELADDSILNFLPDGKFHWFAKKRAKHSAYAINSVETFYQIMGPGLDSVKKAIVYIPISFEQKELFDNIAAAYLKSTPYDYALFGMRCGSAAYEILGKLGLLPKYSYSKTYRKIFYPRKLRKRLFEKAIQNGWLIVKQNGSVKRKWERD